jgi:hypothetical protein
VSLVPELFSFGARLAGVGVATTALEFVVVAPELVRWRSRGVAAAGGVRPGGARSGIAGRVGVLRALALLLAVGGVAFVVFPWLCLAGGGLAAVLVLAYFVVAFEPTGDGADMMLILVLVGLGALALLPAGWMQLWVWWCLAANVCLAYWWSGFAKIRVAGWRAGRQVALIVNSPRYGTAALAWRLLNHAWLARAMAWGVICLEISCPLFLLLGGWPLVVWAVAAALMHVGVAAVMGLGRFTWSFGAGMLCMLAARLAV